MLLQSPIWPLAFWPTLEMLKEIGRCGAPTQFFWKSAVPVVGAGGEVDTQGHGQGVVL